VKKIRNTYSILLI